MSDPLEGKGAALGQGPQGTGHRWRVRAASLPGPPVHLPQLLSRPRQAQGLTPPNSRLPGGGKGPHSSRGDLGSACLVPMPKASAAPLRLLFSLGPGGQHCRGHLRPSGFPHHASILSAWRALLAQVAAAPPQGSPGRAPAPGVAGRVHLAQRTRRRRRMGSSSSSKRQRGLGVPPPCHPDVPLSPGLPTG